MTSSCYYQCYTVCLTIPWFCDVARLWAKNESYFLACVHLTYDNLYKQRSVVNTDVKSHMIYGRYGDVITTVYISVQSPIPSYSNVYMYHDKIVYKQSHPSALPAIKGRQAPWVFFYIIDNCLNQWGRVTHIYTQSYASLLANVVCFKYDVK